MSDSKAVFLCMLVLFVVPACGAVTLAVVGINVVTVSVVIMANTAGAAVMAKVAGPYQYQ